MKKVKLIAPVLAFAFAILTAFATRATASNEVADNLYENDCQTEITSCKIATGSTCDAYSGTKKDGQAVCSVVTTFNNRP